MGLDGVFARWFAPSAMFANMTDKASPVREAVYERLRTLCLGRAVTPEDAPFACFITGEPTNVAPIAKDDKLYGIKSSAFSNRAGTPEAKFSEDAATRLSPASYAEFKLRGSVKARAGLVADGLPVRVCSPSAGGLSSVAFSNLDNVEFSIAELLRQSTERPHYSGLESFTRRCHFGRYESLPSCFADQSSGGSVAWGRVTFFKAAIQAAYRYGRAVHIFSGLPVPRPEYFYSDCLDPELRLLLGRDGFRLEELPTAIERLDIVSRIAAPAKDNGLNMAATAKAFCVPATRLGAGCLAWAAATATKDGKAVQPALAGRLDEFIQQEIQRMDAESKTNPMVKLGRLAAPIQQGSSYDAGANTEAFLFRTAFEAADLSTTRGYTDRDSLVADVQARIVMEGGRRTEGSKGLFASAENRAAGQSLNDAIQVFAVCFVDDYWLGACRGRRPPASLLSADVATYRYVFTHTKRSKAKPAKPAKAPIAAEAAADLAPEPDLMSDTDADLTLA